MNTSRKVILLLSILFLLFSCTSEKISPESLDDSKSFYPININDTAIFEVKEISYTILGTDSRLFYEKEIITSFDTSYALVSLQRADSLNGVFTTISNFSIDTRNDEIITNKNSSRDLELTFPFNTSTSYDLNLYNNKEVEILNIDSVDATISTSFSTIKFDNSLRLSITPILNNIEDIQFYRVYQKNKGLVFELDKNIEKQPGQIQIGFFNTRLRLN